MNLELFELPPDFLSILISLPFKEIMKSHSRYQKLGNKASKEYVDDVNKINIEFTKKNIAICSNEYRTWRYYISIRDGIISVNYRFDGSVKFFSFKYQYLINNILKIKELLAFS